MSRKTTRASESPTALGAQRVVGLSPASPTDFGPTMNEEPDSDKEHDSEAQCGEHPWRDEDLMRELYCDRGLTCQEIGDELGCSAKTVSRWLGRHGIEARDALEAGLLVSFSHVPFETYSRGYERWVHASEEARQTVRVHRLLAVAERGFDVVAGMDVHHENGIPWDNRPDNIELLHHAEHASLHQAQRGGGSA